MSDILGGYCDILDEYGLLGSLMYDEYMTVISGEPFGNDKTPQFHTLSRNTQRAWIHAGLKAITSYKKCD